MGYAPSSRVDLTNQRRVASTPLDPSLASGSGSRVRGYETPMWTDRLASQRDSQYSAVHPSDPSPRIYSAASKQSGRRYGQQPSQRGPARPPTRPVISERQLSALDSKIKNLEVCFNRFAARES